MKMYCDITKEMNSSLNCVDREKIEKQLVRNSAFKNEEIWFDTKWPL